jgi:hypothetical protein
MSNRVRCCNSANLGNSWRCGNSGSLGNSCSFGNSWRCDTFVDVATVGRGVTEGYVAAV